MLLLPTLLSCLGLLVSTYGYFIEKKLKNDHTYKPVCDISDKISCSKPFLSEYGTILQIPNTIVGMAFYSSALGLSLLEYKQVLFYLSVGGTAASLYLAYILYTKIRSLCLICTTTYIINIGLLIASYKSL